MHELETLLSRLKMEHLGYHVESLLEQAAKKELNYREFRKRLVRTVLIFTESSDQLSRATDRVPGLPASPGYVQ